jgi:glycosyltransferase involved in cell wall biosynthesis
LNICLISQEYPPETGWGGIATYTHTLAHALKDLGHFVCVLSRSLNNACVYQDEGVLVCRVWPTTFPVPFVHSYVNLFGPSWTVFRWIKRLMRQYQIEIVEAPEFGAEAFFFARSRRRPVPLVVRLHTPHVVTEALEQSPPTVHSRIIHWMERETIRRASHVTSPSQSLALLCREKMDLKDLSFSVLPNPVRRAQWMCSEASPVSSSEQPSILYVGRLQRLKNVITLVQTMPRILERFPRAELTLIGDDTLSWTGRSSYQKKLEEVAATLGIAPHIRFLGKLSREAIVPYLRKANLCVFPSLFENFPYVCLEAMSCGRPVVASRAGGLSEMIVDGESGLLFDPRDPHDLAEKAIRVLSDRDLAERLGGHAKRRVEANYDHREIARRTIELYQQAM